ncbi:nucleotide sugar transporter SLC35D2 isoform X2 [Phyllobates terribilis]|uniref:nucleotide sugar transporter SLC35D2 isoform X2 n=1 Tax=Phyllobates terribilis TaxID=111132 RepID=UPI003CCA9136
MSPKTEVVSTRTARLLSAVFYAVSSFLIVLVNKTVLTSYRFPSSTLLGVGQMGFTILILYFGKVKGIITFPDFDRDIPKKLFPLPFLYIGNHLTGLSSTQKLSLPMFTVLRKFAILFTLILEIVILRKRFSIFVTLSILAIVIGAFIAASFDLTFNLEAYTIVLMNDLFTAAYGVYTKEKMNPQELGKYGVLFYNAAFMILPTLLFTLWTGEFEKVCAPLCDGTLQLPQFTTYYHSHWCPQECICRLHWNFYWRRLYVFLAKFFRLKYLHGRWSSVLFRDILGSPTISRQSSTHAQLGRTKDCFITSYKWREKYGL